MPPRGGRARAGRGRGGTARAPAEASAAESSTPAASDTPADSTPAVAGTSQPITKTSISDSRNADSRSDTVASASPAAASSSVPVASSSRGTTRANKFKPKAVRRGEEERLRLAEEVARAQAQRNADEARFEARANRARGRGRGRGRGGFMRGMPRASTAAGPLSAGMSSIGSGSGPKGGGYGTSSLVDNSRINADTLYTAVDYSDEDEPVIKGRQKRKKAPMPMGIRRVEHEEEKVTMASTADIEAKERGLEKAEAQDDEDSSDGLFVDEARTKETTHIPAKDEGVWEHALPESRVKIKAEEADQMELEDIPEGGTKTPDSPEQKKKDLLKAKKKKGDTEEELLAQDLEHMINFFTFADDVKKGEEKEGGSSKDGHMFLFQFPPVLPPLTPVAPEAGQLVKPEPTEDDDDDEDIVMFAPQKKTAPVNIDLTEGADKIKSEGDAEDGGDQQAEPQEVGGFVGNLVVRKSGKVELSWGGNILELAPGTQANFLSQAVLVEQSDEKVQPSQASGSAYGMGKIWGSFSAVPTWGGEEEWAIDPEDLVTPVQ
ncbi:RNA polymerase III RPC4-domain-containing protein [Immersiella caudata]|uniref:RNA polymerase III RPC4-domain-containing protein n=1 Tax=Immersiella caudata TaxID=314043 RepID=A0AA39WF73_9PEZI|nr:RNA polymerase III RPC4-domain-containing protein [Immersiella caudata]